MLTPYQIEIAANELCRKRGVDTASTGYYQKEAIKEIQAAIQVQDAIAFASEQTQHVAGNPSYVMNRIYGYGWEQRETKKGGMGQG